MKRTALRRQFPSVFRMLCARLAGRITKEEHQRMLAAVLRPEQEVDRMADRARR